MNFVAADLGASGTRYVTDHGKLQVLPNNITKLGLNQQTPLELNSEDIESALEVTIEKLTNNDIDSKINFAQFPVTLLAGKMAERYSSDYITPDINLLKWKQQVNYISAVMSVAVSKLKFGLDDQILLVLDVPPGELGKAKEMFKANLTGKYKVTFHKYMGGTTVEFEIVDVAVFAESVMAMASFFFNMNGVPKVESRDYMSGRVLSLDIGASTSDVAVIENGKFLDYTGRTFKTGGNVARGAFINYIASEEGYVLPEADAEVAIAEGRLAYGSEYTDVGEMVERAKRELANQLITMLKTYFNEIKIPIQSIKAIVVSGGGSMEGQYINESGEVVKTSNPLSKYVTESIQSICKGVKAVPYGEDARFANTKGLFIRAKVLMAKLAAQQNAAAQQVAQQNAVAQQVTTPVQSVVQPVVQTVATPVQPVVNIAPAAQAVGVTPTV